MDSPPIPQVVATADRSKASFLPLFFVSMLTTTYVSFYSNDPDFLPC